MGSLVVTANGSSVQTAQGPQTLVSGSKPLSKLDTTNSISFETIQLLFNHDPPNPTAFNYTNTQVYSAPHGYKGYIPTTWLSWQNPAPAPTASPPTSGATALRTFGFGDDCNSLELLNDIATGSAADAFGDTVVAEELVNSSGTILTASQAYLCVTADTTNVYISILKESIGTVSGSAVAISLLGITLNMRLYVFVEPATTSTY